MIPFKQPKKRREKEQNGTTRKEPDPLFLLPNFKKQLTMLQLSKLISIFVPWFSKDPRHRGELFIFDPSENLQNSKLYGKKSESCFSCSSIYTAYPLVGLAHINTCRCELIFILTHTGIPGPSN
jgi:hypothetical protein